MNPTNRHCDCPRGQERATEANALNYLGIVFNVLSLYEKAIECYELALATYRELRSKIGTQGKPQKRLPARQKYLQPEAARRTVVLSACQTGLGKEIKGERLVGLTRGFMYAGAARVVVSSWNVNDKATADLMTKFYEKMLKQGARPAAALAPAQVEMGQKQWQSPNYWAGFTMQGEWR